MFMVTLDFTATKEMEEAVNLFDVEQFNNVMVAPSFDVIKTRMVYVATEHQKNGHVPVVFSDRKDEGEVMFETVTLSCGECGGTFVVTATTISLSDIGSLVKILESSRFTDKTVQTLADELLQILTGPDLGKEDRLLLLLRKLTGLLKERREHGT